MTEPIASVLARSGHQAPTSDGAAPADRDDRRSVDPATLLPTSEPGRPPRVPDRYYGVLDDLEPTDPVRRVRAWLEHVRADPGASRGLLLLGPVGTASPPSPARSPSRWAHPPSRSSGAPTTSSAPSATRSAALHDEGGGRVS
jgi:hypothetical protein